MLSAALFSLMHGANDAQKTMGIITGVLVTAGYISTFDVPFWVVLAAHLAIGLGTLSGGWRIVRTMGTKITKLAPVGGFAAETGAAVAILIATLMGIGISTTHTITGSIVGVGRDAAAVGGALGRGWPHRLGVDPDHSGCGVCRRVDLLDAVGPGRAVAAFGVAVRPAVLAAGRRPADVPAASTVRRSVAQSDCRLNLAPCGAQLGSQPPDVHIYRTGLDRSVVAPHPLQQAVARQHATPVLHQAPQQLELPPRQLDRRPST